MNFEQWYLAGDAASVRWLWTMAHFLWQGLAVALVVFTATWLLRRASAALRYAVLLGGLAAMVLCPVVTFCLLGPTLPSTPSSAVSSLDAGESESTALQKVSALPPEETGPLESLEVPDEVVPPAAANETPAAETPLPGKPWWNRWAWGVVGLYALGVSLLLVRIALGLQGGKRLCRRSQSVTDGGLLALLARQTRALQLRTAPVLAFCRDVAVPTVVGILRPTILLPLSTAARLALHDVEVILAHELAHIRRHDHLVNLFQRMIEAFLFFHPAVWWLSRRIRAERENCCDDLVVSLGVPPLSYATSLLHLAELSQAAAPGSLAVVGLYALRDPSQLRRRVARLLGADQQPPVRLVRAWPLAATLLLAVAFTISAFVSPGTGQVTEPSAIPTEPSSAPRGRAVDGLQARILTVAPDTDEQAPSLATAKPQTQYAQPRDLTLLVELKNVGDHPIVLQGTRYGDSVGPPWPGKSVSDHFAPGLFHCDFLDKEGRRIEEPAHKILDVDTMLLLSGGMAETLPPGKSLVMLIRPLRWDAGMIRSMASGNFKVRVHYHGPSSAVLQEMKKVWPDKALTKAWSGDVVSGEAAFRIAGDPQMKLPDLVWGKAVKGLQAAVEFQSPADTAQGLRDTANVAFPLGSRVNVRLHIKNVSKEAITFWSETWRQDDKVMLLDPTGKEKELQHAWYSGEPIMEHWTLRPGQEAILQAISLGLATDEEASKKFEHPIGPMVIGKPDKYRLLYRVRFGGIQQRDKDGKIVLPGEKDWQGTLDTGIAAVTVRPRRPEDKPPTFKTSLQFRSADGRPVAKGHVEVQVQTGGRSLFEGDLKAEHLVVADCPPGALTVLVRAPGYEETRFYDVAVKAGQVTSLTLKPAEPVRFRLVTHDGKPVAGAKVRFFNRSKVLAGSGPYPTDGIHGPVWATSTAKGDVVLDMLQKIDPADPKLGNNIYWFYVEPPKLGPLFIGPVQAGANLGKISVGPLLDVYGFVYGTKEELDAFSAEWDQPEPMKSREGEAPWIYAESKQLETKKEGNNLTFHLTGLRPGKLRIVSRFQRGGAAISHTYSRRDVTGNDVLYEIDLTGAPKDWSSSDHHLHLTSQPQRNSVSGPTFEAELIDLRHHRVAEAGREAIVAAYEEFLRRYPNHPRIPEAMLDVAYLMEVSIPEKGVAPDRPATLAWTRKAVAAAKPGSDVWNTAQFYLGRRLVFSDRDEARGLLVCATTIGHRSYAWKTHPNHAPGEPFPHRRTQTRGPCRGFLQLPKCRKNVSPMSLHQVLPISLHCTLRDPGLWSATPSG